jgi:transmembrane sensor
MKKEYEHYTAEDFITDEYFQQWAQFPDKESNAAWNSWRLKHPHKEPEIRIALTFINSLQFNTRFPPPSQAELSLERNLQKISFSEARQKRKRPFFQELAFRSFAAVMVISFCALAAWFYFYSEPVSIRVSTAANETRSVTLPDSSRVMLNSHSSLAYPANLPVKRLQELWVEGEAFFEGSGVQKRFIIHTERLNIETKGARFNIRQAVGFTNLSVNEGSIKVQVSADPNTILQLEAGDFMRYSVAQKHIVRKKVIPELYSAWTEKEIKLDSLPVHVVIQWLEDISGNKVVTKPAAIADPKISGVISMEDETAFLQSLSRAMKAGISKEGQAFVIDFAR